MIASISMITLGVRDLKRATRFYREGLGWNLSSASNEYISFFLMSGTALALFPWSRLAEDTSVTAQGSGFRGVVLAHNVPSKEAVDQALETVERAEGRIVKPAEDAFWGGYSGHFADLDNHLWEVAWNPQFRLLPDGRVELPR